MSDRLKKTFENKSKKLVTFTTGGDPDLETSFEILKTIINNNIDIVEIGMPFSDPMADGPTIQESSTRSIENGTTIQDILALLTVTLYQASPPMKFAIDATVSLTVLGPKTGKII